MHISTLMGRYLAYMLQRVAERTMAFKAGGHTREIRVYLVCSIGFVIGVLVTTSCFSTLIFK